MALLTRRRVSAPAQLPAVDAATRERLQKQIDNPSTGDIMRRALRRKLSGVTAVGPTNLHPEPAPMSREDEILARKRDAGIAREHREIVERELKALDAHAANVEKRRAVFPPDSRSYEAAELAAEARMLRELRAMLEDDRDQGPILKDRDGRPVDDRMRAIIRAEARESAESFWRAAERERAAGDFREARRHRIDSLRARMVAEYSNRLRPSMPGYGLCAWT